MLSVITLTYNNYNELIKTINSIENIDSIESVIINGGDCYETFCFLKNTDSISISEPDEGISDAFNKGIKNSSGDFIIFLNSGDVLIDKDFYGFALDFFSKNPNVQYIYSDIIIDHKYLGKKNVKPNLEHGKTPFPHPGLIVRKNVFNEIGNFDTNLKTAMDFDFMCRMINHNLKGYYYKKKPVVLMDGNGVSSNKGLIGINERLLILKRNNMLNHEAFFYLNKIKIKTYLRVIIGKVGLLNYYDKIKFFFNKKIE